MTDVDKYYKDNYDKVLNSGFIGKLSGFVHWFTEFQVPRSDYGKTLEVGSGSGQHKFFVKNIFEEYLETDLRVDNPGKQSLEISGRTQVVNRIQADAQNLDFIEDGAIDRFIATCLLVHLPDPERALIEWRRVLSHNGVATIFLPCEPGILLRTFRFFSTVPKSRKLGLNHKSIHYREHRNMYIFCDMLIKEVFAQDSVRRVKFPIPFLPWNFRLFDLVIITKKDYAK